MLPITCVPCPQWYFGVGSLFVPGSQADRGYPHGYAGTSYCVGSQRRCRRAGCGAFLPDVPGSIADYRSTHLSSGRGAMHIAMSMYILKYASKNDKVSSPSLLPS